MVDSTDGFLEGAVSPFPRQLGGLGDCCKLPRRVPRTKLVLMYFDAQEAASFCPQHAIDLSQCCCHWARWAHIAAGDAHAGAGAAKPRSPPLTLTTADLHATTTRLCTVDGDLTHSGSTDP